MSETTQAAMTASEKKQVLKWNKSNSNSQVWISFYIEFRVRDNRNKNADYFTESLEDAIETATLMAAGR